MFHGHSFPVPGNKAGIDIGRLIEKQKKGPLSDSEVAQGLTERWKPACDDDFPSSLHQTKNKKGDIVTERRRVTRHHLDSKKWLAVSKLPGYEGAWCAVCVLFKGAAPKQEVFVLRPLTSFRRATERNGPYDSHERSAGHKDCVIKAAEFLNRTRDDGATAKGDIRNLIDSARMAEAEANRQALRPLIDVTLTCARQNIPMRGHRDDGRLTEDEPDANDGNFRSLVRLLVRHGDGVLKKHLEVSPSNATYTSKTTQNQILECAASLIRDKVRDSVSDRFFSVLADETTDAAGREQLVIVLRYVMQEDGKWCVREDPWRIVDLLKEIEDNTGANKDELGEVQMTGENIGQVIVEKLEDLGPGTTSRLIGCGFDGAPAMSSENVGAAAALKRASPLCEFFHCSMHALNLCVAAGCKQPDVRNCNAIVKGLASFFSTSAKRLLALRRAISAVAPQETRTKLVALCTTRLLERHDAIICLCDLLPAVIRCLEEMTSWHSTDTRQKASQLLGSLRSSCFIVSLFSLKAVSAVLLPVSRALQAKDMDIVTAERLLESATQIVQEWRREPEQKFAEIFSDAERAAERLGEVIHPPRCASSSVYRANAGECADSANYFRINIFIPLLANIQLQMEARFGERQQTSLRLRGLLPSQLKPWSDIEEAVERYSNVLDGQQKQEIETWSAMWADKPSKERPTTALAALDLCPPECLPNVASLLQILAALPVTTAEPERFFSRVTLVETAIRTTMTEERLEAICMLQAYRQMHLTVESVLEQFTKSRRRKDFVL